MLEILVVDRVDPLLDPEFPLRRAQPPCDDVCQKERCPISLPPELQAGIAVLDSQPFGHPRGDFQGRMARLALVASLDEHVADARLG